MGGDALVEELFVLDRRRKEPTLTKLLTSEQRQRLPESLALFEISPDARHVLVPDTRSDILLLSLSDGVVERIRTGLENDGSHHVPAPSWRAPGEFSYVKKLLGRPELVLRRDGVDIVLSRNWPDDVVFQLVR
jgi:hypothetical protein